MSSVRVEKPYILVDDTHKALEKLAIASRDRSVETNRIGITGSVGKTTVTQALAKVLSSAGTTHCPVSSYNNHVGLPTTLARMPENTRFGVFEMGMNNPGEISALTRIAQPHIALITKIGRAHDANFDNGLQGIAAAKAEIFEGLVPNGIAVINKDNDWFEFLSEKATSVGARILSYSLHSDADARLLDYSETDGEVSIKVQIAGEQYQFPLSQSGKHWAENCLAILLIANTLNIPMGPAIKHLSKIAPLPGRGVIKPLVIDDKHIRLIDDSYNANPDSMIASFDSLKTTPTKGRRIVILTEMRELSHAEDTHKSLAPHLVAAKVDLVFAVGEHMKALYNALPEKMKGKWQLSYDELFPSLLKHLENNDLVLVKGSNSSGAKNIVSQLESL